MHSTKSGTKRTRNLNSWRYLWNPLNTWKRKHTDFTQILSEKGKLILEHPNTKNPKEIVRPSPGWAHVLGITTAPISGLHWSCRYASTLLDEDIFLQGACQQSTLQALVAGLKGLQHKRGRTSAACRTVANAPEAWWAAPRTPRATGPAEPA